MSKILVLGDIHGRDCWKNIILKENPDKVIFLGDYVSTHEDITEEFQITNLESILQYKEANPESTILLRGNHDLEALNYRWARCSPTTGEIVKEYFCKNKDRFLSNTQWIYLEDNIIFVHAGISKVWLDNQNIALDEINNLSPSEKFGFIPSSLGDYYGESETQSCVWIRPQSLVNCFYKPDEYIQVVAHTTVNEIVNTHEINSDYPNIWLCDCLPKKYLIIEDSKFISKKIFED